MPLRRTLLTATWLVAGAAGAQLPGSVDITMAHDPAGDMLYLSLRANGAYFSQVLSNLVFTIRWPDSSPATLGAGYSAWCPPPSVAFPVAPTAMLAPGNGFNYRTYVSVGLAQLGDLADDGGCEQGMPADEWVEVYAIQVNGDPGGTLFEIADDEFVQENNRSYFVSLNGIAVTGGIIGLSTPSPAGPMERSALAVHPNPAATGARLVIPAGWDGAWQASVLDAAGRVVARFSGSGPSASLDCSWLTSGRYIIRLDGQQGAVAAPFSVMR
ncbi:MAG: T9SS type A sorting domain-containing protein [Flavobacteriales bacterium]